MINVGSFIKNSIGLINNLSRSLAEAKLINSVFLFIPRFHDVNKWSIFYFQAVIYFHKFSYC